MYSSVELASAVAAGGPPMRLVTTVENTSSGRYTGTKYGSPIICERKSGPRASAVGSGDSDGVGVSEPAVACLARHATEYRRRWNDASGGRKCDRCQDERVEHLHGSVSTLCCVVKKSP